MAGTQETQDQKEKLSEFSENKKKGRPKKAEAEQKEVELLNIFSEQEITPTISFLLNTIFERKNWQRLSADEEKNLGNVLTKVLNKHFPKVITKYVEEMQLAIVVGGIITARILSGTGNAKQNNSNFGQKGERENDRGEKTIEQILSENNN